MKGISLLAQIADCRLPPKACVTCGKSFLPTVAARRYCGDPCNSYQARKAKLRAQNGNVGKGWSAKRKFAPRTVCLTCGAEFYAPPVQRRRGGGKYCSNVCFGVSQRKPSPLRATGTCVTCGQEFTDYPCRIRRRKYCSHVCVPRAIRRRLELVAPHYCLNCKTVVISKARKFCSTKCRGSYMVGDRATNYSGGRPMGRCESCGVEYRVPAGSMGRFCSMRCMGRERAKECRERGYSRSKGGKRADLGGVYFRSRWEANWARYLNWLIERGEILSWSFEPETFEFHTIKRGARFYTPDFRVVNKNGSVEFHEVKGWMDAKSATKLRRMAKHYPKVKIVLIDKTQYMSVGRVMKGLIAGWEIDPKKAA